MSDSRRERGREQWAKRSLSHWEASCLVLCPVSAVSRSVGHIRAGKTVLEAFPCSVQGSNTPLRWSLLLAFSALAFVGSRSSQLRTQPRTEPRARRSCLRARPRDVQGLCRFGEYWPRIGLNAPPYLVHGDCTEASRRFQASWGFGLCGVPIACADGNSLESDCIASIEVRARTPHICARMPM